MAESINLEPNWDGMRRWVINVARTDPERAREIASHMGSEAPNLDFCGGCGSLTDTTREAHCNKCGFPDGAVMLERGWKRNV